MASSDFYGYMLPIGIVDFAIQWIGCSIAVALHTEKYYDLTGSLTFFLLTFGALASGDSFRSHGIHIRQLDLSAMVLIWCSRLGLFLFMRIQEAGEDKRFRKAKQKVCRHILQCPPAATDALGQPALMLLFWTVQGLWILLTAMPMFVTNGLPASQLPMFGIFDAVGLALWCFGFGLEVMADHQKNLFRRMKDKPNAWIESGVWSWSRHPNYLGEMVLWIGVAISALGSFPALSWLEMVLILASPTFVCFLLLRVSGIPLLERSADKRWGEEPAYKAYKQRTACLVPGLY